MINLYLGCGPRPIHPQHIAVMNSVEGEWELSDKYIVQEGARQYDAFNIPHPSGSINCIYTSHLLEHIKYGIVKELLSYWNSLLRRGGLLIINVPDMEWACERFIITLKEEREHIINQHQVYNRTIDFDSGAHTMQAVFYGSQVHQGEFHKSCYTVDSLKALLESVGFNIEKITKSFESHDVGCIIAEARKGNNA